MCHAAGAWSKSIRVGLGELRELSRKVRRTATRGFENRTTIIGATLTTANMYNALLTLTLRARLQKHAEKKTIICTTSGKNETEKQNEGRNYKQKYILIPPSFAADFPSLFFFLNVN